jgi:transcriptional regulator with XRE-family HTH domain
MNTIEYIERVKAKLGISSDYALAQKLGITKQAMSRYTRGLGHFDDEVCARVAAILGIHAGLVMLDMHMQRAHTPEQANIWKDIAKGFHTLLPRAKNERRKFSLSLSQ